MYEYRYSYITGVNVTDTINDMNHRYYKIAYVRVKEGILLY